SAALPGAFQVGVSVGEPQAGSARAWLAGSAPSPFRKEEQASSRWKIERLVVRTVSARLAGSVPEAPCQRASSIARRQTPTQIVYSFVYTWQNFSSRNGLPPRFGSNSENPMPGTPQKLARRLEIAEVNPCIPLRTKLRQAQTTGNFCFLLY